MAGNINSRSVDQSGVQRVIATIVIVEYRKTSAAEVMKLQSKWRSSVVRERMVGVEEVVGDLKRVLSVHQMGSQLMVPQLRFAMNCVDLYCVMVGSHNDPRADFLHLIMVI